MTKPTDPRLSSEEREAIRRRVEQATPGPWTHYAGSHGVYAGQSAICTTCGPRSWPDSPRTLVRPLNGEFIAHARTDLPAVLAEGDALRAQLQQVTQERDEAREASSQRESPYATLAATWRARYAAGAYSIVDGGEDLQRCAAELEAVHAGILMQAKDPTHG